MSNNNLTPISGLGDYLPIKSKPTCVNCGEPLGTSVYLEDYCSPECFRERQEDDDED